jgi:8-oxo-dGTP diphosphatase
MHGDGNGWTDCDRGHRHWGRFGAAGLLVTDGEQVLLQYRAAWTHDGNSWGIPGGALDSHEDPATAARREAAEETDLDLSQLTAGPVSPDDHGGWSYTTVLAWTDRRDEVRPLSPESDRLAWYALDAVNDLPLHWGFKLAWPDLRNLIVLNDPTVATTD